MAFSQAGKSSTFTLISWQSFTEIDRSRSRDVKPSSFRCCQTPPGQRLLSACKVIKVAAAIFRKPYYFNQTLGIGAKGCNAPYLHPQALTFGSPQPTYIIGNLGWIEVLVWPFSPLKGSLGLPYGMSRITPRAAQMISISVRILTRSEQFSDLSQPPRRRHGWTIDSRLSWDTTFQIPPPIADF